MKTQTIKSLLILVIGVVLLNQAVIAQSGPTAVLKSSDVDRFIDTYNSMASEFELLDDAMEVADDSDDMTYEAVLKCFESGLENNEAVAIIEKYGWDKSTYGQKIMAIAMGTTYLMVLSQIEDMPEEQGKAMIELFNNQYKALVHEDDLNVLKPRMSELEEFFKEE
jgi:hypothetical protein